MSGIMETLAATYNFVVHELADSRTAEWFGVSNPFVVLAIVSAYLYFCKSLGPRLMNNRQPFELKTTLLIYNTFQVLFSLFLVYEGSVLIFNKEYNLACQPIDFSTSPRALRFAAGTWYYFIAKLSELLDTVFFVLRKKYNQVSFLHVYHHTLMVLIIWFGVKYYPGGHSIVMGYLNSIVHVIMYSYYLISGLGPEYQKYIWWKKHVTLIQLIQFSLVFIHHFAVFFYECNYPRAINILIMINSVAFMYMFGNFYIKNYNQNSGNKTALNAKKGTSVCSKLNNVSMRRKVAEKSR